MARISAWSKGVALYAEELKEFLAENNLPPTKESMLNGDADWRQYSYGGCTLIYDADIADRLCSPSELKRCRSGYRAPNGRETWLDCQARALNQACIRVIREARKCL